MQDLISQPLRTIAEAIRSKQITSQQLVREFLDRIESVNGELNALVASNADHALKYAAKADADLNNGEVHGPLHGIPMTIKDSLDTKDIVTTWGTTGRKTFLPGKDATVVGRLRSAGAVLLGKTNTPEFTLSFQTDNKLFGPTRNPFNLDHSPGGSSGGAAALIASGASLFDVGTDTGGSIRLPSHFCGIAGLKPTTGRLPCTGNALPSSGLIARLSQPGPMARYVEDLEFLLAIMEGPDNIDPNVVPAISRKSADVDITGLRIGYHTDNGVAAPDSDIVSTIEQAVNLLSEAGCKVTQHRPSSIEMTNLILARLFSADGGELLDALLEDCRTDDPSAQIAPSLEHRLAISQQEFAHIIDLWDNYRSSMLSSFNDIDVLISPVNARTALKLGEQEEIQNYTYTGAYNLTGWPAAVIRAGTDSSALPIGVQIIAAPFREDHCLAIAGWLEGKFEKFSDPDVFCK